MRKQKKVKAQTIAPVFTNFRQGDVGIFSAEMTKAKAPADMKEVKRQVLAEGEVTGHSHQLLPETAEVTISLAQTEWGFFATVKGGNGVIKHEEHGPITLPPGNYDIRVQREYDPSGFRRVQD